MESVSKIDRIYKYMENIVAKEYISTTIFDRIKSAQGVFPYEVKTEQVPYVVVMPSNREELVEIVKYANMEKIPIFISTSGTHALGGTRPHTHGIALSMHRLNKIEFLEEYGFFECEAGCICNKVGEALDKKGYFLPMAPGSRLIATMGGLISNNTSGHVVDTSIGKPGDYVYGLEVVLPNGEIIETGTMGLRRPSGTDLTKYFIGGDGLFGIITKIRMRLLPGIHKAYGAAIFDNLISLAKGVQRMHREMCPSPLFMEFMAQDAAKIGYEIKGMPPPKGSVIFFVCIGNTEEEARNKVDRILKSLQAEKPLEAFTVDDINLWNNLWSTREVLGSFLMRKGDQWMAAEVVSNLKDLPECMDDAQNFYKDIPLLSQLESHLYGHIGGLTFHPGALMPRQWDSETKKNAIDEKFRKEMELNIKYNTCGGEWGQFSKRTDFFIKRYGQAGYEFVKGLKRTIDPNNILNPGVLEGYR